MEKEFKPLILVPTYNEALNIKFFLNEIFKFCPDINVLIIDDNSPDGTAEIVHQMCDKRIYILKRTKKSGLASAYIEGFKKGIDLGFNQFIEMDADFSHKPEYLPIMLENLKNKGYKLAIVTSKNRSTALRGLKYLKILDYFEVLVSSDEVENHKPHPEPVLKACEILEVSPKNSIMVGDSIYDIMSGRNAGSKTCGVCYSFMKDKLLEMKADYYIEDLIEILDIVQAV